MSGENIAFVKVNIIVDGKDLKTTKNKTKKIDSASASRTLEVNDT